MKVITKEEYAIRQEPKIVHQGFHQSTDQMEFSNLLESDKIVLDALKRVEAANRSDLVELCALPRTTIYDALIRLERIGVIERYHEERMTRGRPKTFYRVL